MTGVRIASTLGGFFLLVLLTLWYKSKCKGKHSREPSTLTLNSIPFGGGHVTLMRGQNIQVNGHQFPPGLNQMTLDSISYGNQIHPEKGGYPQVFTNCVPRGEGDNLKNPAVLLITAQESSDEESSGRDNPEVLYSPVSPPLEGVQSKGGGKFLGDKGNIDIHVILPTPSISPSGSENFNSGQYFGGNSLLPKGAPRGRLLVSRSLSSEQDSELSECSVVSEELAFGGKCSVFSLDNLKYVDDTSSENIPTGNDPDSDDKEEDSRSIGSDSVFACFEHNFDHVAPTRRVSSVSGTSSGLLCSPYPGRSICQNVMSNHLPPPPVPAKDDLPVTIQAQVHHRDSFCSDLESVNDYMETGARRRRSSSTQTTLSDLRQALGFCPWGLGVGAGVGTTSPGQISITSTDISTRRLSVPRRRRSLSPHVRQVPTSLPIPTRDSPSQTSTPATPTNPLPTVVLSPSSPFPQRQTRKRSFDAVRKSLSLQCDDKADPTSLFGSSNETTPTN